MISQIQAGMQVRIITPENKALNGAMAFVSKVEEWGAHLLTEAAATGRFRAAWHEMGPYGEGETGGKALSVVSGFTGDICGHCGGSRMIRAGACLCCQDCGTSGGCG